MTTNDQAHLNEITEKINQCKKEELLIRQKRENLEEELKQMYSTALHPGDVVLNRDGYRRLIVRTDPTTLISVDAYGYQQGSALPSEQGGRSGNTFQGCDYKKIGTLAGFLINELPNHDKSGRE